MYGITLVDYRKCSVINGRDLGNPYSGQALLKRFVAAPQGFGSNFVAGERERQERIDRGLEWPDLGKELSLSSEPGGGYSSGDFESDERGKVLSRLSQSLPQKEKEKEVLVITLLNDQANCFLKSSYRYVSAKSISDSLLHRQKTPETVG